MKKVKGKIVLIAIGLIVASIIISKVVYALSFKFIVTANKTEVKAGEEIEVEMKIAEINMGELRNKCIRVNTRV